MMDEASAVNEASRGQSRHRAEADAQAVSAANVERNATLALEVAQAAGIRHKEANSVMATQIEQMAAALQAVGHGASGTLLAGTDVIEKNVGLAGELAATKVAKAQATSKVAELTRQLAHHGAGTNDLDAGLRSVLGADPVAIVNADTAEAASSVAKAMSSAALQTASRSAGTMANAVMTATQDMRRQLATYRQRALDAEAAAGAMEESVLGHRAEVEGLLDAISKFANLAGNSESIQAENQRLKAYLRSLEATMPPEQIASAALPANYQPPASFRQFPGALSPVLRTAAPALFAIRAMDHRELTLTEVVREWVDMSETLGKHRDALAAAEATIGQLKDAHIRLEASVVDERVRRHAAENTIHQQAIRRLEPGDRHELDACRVKLSLALDEKVALALKLDAADKTTAEAKAESNRLRERVEELQSQLSASSVAPVLASMRRLYEQEESRLVGECARLRSGWATTLAHAEELDKRVKAAVGAVATSQKATRSSAVAAEQARGKQLELAKQLAASQARCAQLEKELARATTALADAQQQSQALGDASAAANAKAGRSPVVSKVAAGVIDTCAALKRCDAALATLVSGHVSQARESIEAAGDLGENAATLGAIHRIARGVESALTDTGRIRSAILEQAAAKDVRIGDLEAALDRAVADMADLRERLASAEAVVERVAVPVAETVIGHAVPDAAEVNCPSCDAQRAVTSAAEASFVEAQSRIRALELREEDLYNQVADLTLRNSVGAAELSAKRGTVERLQRRLAEARAEIEAIVQLREDLRLALAARGGHDVDVTDDDGPSAAAVPTATDGNNGGGEGCDGDDDDAANAPAAAAATATAAPTTAAANAEHGIAEQLTSLRSLLAVLVQAAKTAKAAQSVADEANAAKLLTEASAAAADDDDDGGDDAAAVTSTTEPPASVDRRNLLATVQRLWAAALECRGPAASEPRAASSATPTPTDNDGDYDDDDDDDDNDDGGAAAAAAAHGDRGASVPDFGGGGLLPPPPGPTLAELHDAQTKLRVSESKAQEAEAMAAAAERKAAALAAEVEEMKEQVAKGTGTQDKMGKLLQLYQKRIQALEAAAKAGASAQQPPPTPPSAPSAPSAP